MKLSQNLIKGDKIIDENHNIMADSKILKTITEVIVLSDRVFVKAHPSHRPEYEIQISTFGLGFMVETTNNEVSNNI